jgi:hypothetical protein
VIYPASWTGAVEAAVFVVVVLSWILFCGVPDARKPHHPDDGSQSPGTLQWSAP